MTRTNQCNFLVDFLPNKYFGETNIGKDRKTPFARFSGYVHDSAESRAVRGLRFVAYGYKAELAYAYIQGGTRAFVISHVQIRQEYDKITTEFVIEDLQYIKNYNEEEGSKKRKELVERGVLAPPYQSLFPVDSAQEPAEPVKGGGE